MARPKYRDLTHEQLVSLLEARDRKKFGLVWERDAIEADRALNSDFIALDEIPDLGAGGEIKENLIIEGDNFDALRALKVAYAGKVKCIYIDPPYNTGNRDFVYNDRFVDKDHNWRHSLWLEFMFQRLTLARDLLAHDGAIFVSIDDNEIFHLGLLMNEVFGEGNFLGNFIWQHSVQPKGYSGKVSLHHNYTLGYACSDSFALKDVPRIDSHNVNYSNPDDDPNGPWRSGDVRNALFRPNLIYDLTSPSGKVIKPPSKGWRWSKETMAEKIKTGEIVFRDGETRIVRKIYLNKLDGRSVESIWFAEEVGTTREGNKELKASLGDSYFSTPKPTRLIERILQIATNPGDLVLDFFAGSGTTGHAVLKMNAASPDAEPRRFILVSNTEATADEPEKNLCRDVCRQRVANVISGYSDVPGTGGSFAYLRTRRIPLTRVVRRIEHAQVWLFLQLMHFGDLAADAPLASGRLHARRTPEQSVFYPITLTEAILHRLDKEREHAANVTIYTWQPDALATRMESPGISILPIPQTLIDRFGPRP
jgi:adenine-specific DNA-methyltransferase